MTQKIEARILEGKVEWIKEKGSPPKLDGNLLIEFTCTTCHSANTIEKDLADYDGTESLYKCESCNEPYSIGIEARDPIIPRIGDKESVELHKQVIPTLQKIRGVRKSDSEFS